MYTVITNPPKQLFKHRYDEHSQFQISGQGSLKSHTHISEKASLLHGQAYLPGSHPA